MQTLVMKKKWLGREDIPYECLECPECSALNWFVGMNPEPGLYEPETVQCWKCKKVFWLTPEDQDLKNHDAVLMCEGQIDPAVPQHVLEVLVDAATEQIEDMKVSVRSEADDPETVSLVYEIEDCINYVKTLLREGNLPRYKPPHSQPPWLI